MITVVEHRNVEVAAEHIKETHQRSRSLRELEAKQLLVCQPCRPAANHVTHMQHRGFVLRQVYHLIV